MITMGIFHLTKEVVVINFYESIKKTIIEYKCGHQKSNDYSRYN